MLQEQFLSFEEEIARLAQLSGIRVPNMAGGPLAFFAGLSAWLMSASAAAKKRIALVLPDPALNLALPYPRDELTLALAIAEDMTPAPTQVSALAARFNLSEDLLDRPVTGLSGGERMLVSLAKVSALASNASAVYACSPYFWLDAKNRSLVATILDQIEASGGQAHLLTLIGENAPIDPTVPRTNYGSGPTLDWTLLVPHIDVCFPGATFPKRQSSKRLRFRAAQGTLNVLSPLLLSGANGVGKTTFAKLLAGIIVPASTPPTAVVDGFSEPARLILQDALVHLFGETPETHLERVFRFDAERKKEAFVLYREMESRAAHELNRASTSTSVGAKSHAETLLQAKIVLIAERLASRVPLLILDEPGWCLAQPVAAILLDATVAAAHARGTAVAVISHQADWWRNMTLEELLFCDEGNGEVSITRRAN
ncbi:MAG TPA: hypothetical protein VNA69_08055 [Thermoanaerobaculia bacterium]|nr:hypothetical protein [Thermoanaerobaculia bacterium]